MECGRCVWVKAGDENGGSAGAKDDPEEGPDGWPEAEYLLADKECSRTAVMCVSRPPGAPVDAGTVAEFRRECEEVRAKRAAVITDSAFFGKCRLEVDMGGAKVWLWDRLRLRRDLRTHLLGVREGADAEPLGRG